ncbi:hypothetical protein IP86_02745 [Rhodopseudomonas sp. AAP120]|uniref:hypothetical protein n=1 Tax=Rhodopseudomonas TaxID=1073 RepID=UPI000164A5D2|nr:MULTISPECIES: hypothetical protein [Rhodopseudomonas]ACF00825.1 hypothetical protein Rpal_2307 [Rhodopseudomonas palustris TIE-1]KPG01749.1 hypothetical protein IP86_02745 [Rhodopseudomonas sp. AAP120]
MKVTDYTLDPRNARAVKFLQSRPIQIGEPFATSVALFLTSASYRSRKQREAIEAMIERTGWTEPDPLPPAIDDRGERVMSTSIRGGTLATISCTSLPHATKKPLERSASG